MKQVMHYAFSLEEGGTFDVIDKALEFAAKHVRLNFGNQDYDLVQRFDHMQADLRLRKYEWLHDHREKETP
jgi:hypothetical protein